MSDRNHGYDYNHATSGQQFLAIIILVVLVALAGLAIGLSILGVFL